MASGDGSCSPNPSGWRVTAPTLKNRRGQGSGPTEGSPKRWLLCQGPGQAWVVGGAEPFRLAAFEGGFEFWFHFLGLALASVSFFSRPGSGFLLILAWKSFDPVLWRLTFQWLSKAWSFVVWGLWFDSTLKNSGELINYPRGSPGSFPSGFKICFSFIRSKTQKSHCSRLWPPIYFSTHFHRIDIVMVTKAKGQFSSFLIFQLHSGCWQRSPLWSILFPWMFQISPIVGLSVSHAVFLPCTSQVGVLGSILMLHFPFCIFLLPFLPTLIASVTTYLYVDNLGICIADLASEIQPRFPRKPLPTWVSQSPLNKPSVP